jgi:hypothetical protein
MPGKALVRRAIDCRFLFSLSSCRLDMVQEPAVGGICATEPVKLFSTANFWADAANGGAESALPHRRRTRFTTGS